MGEPTRRTRNDVHPMASIWVSPTGLGWRHTRVYTQAPERRKANSRPNTQREVHRCFQVLGHGIKFRLALRPTCSRSASGSSTRVCQAVGCVTYGAERLRNWSPAMYPALDIGPRTHTTRAGMVCPEPSKGNITIVSPGVSCTRVRISTPSGDRFIVKALCFT